MKKILLFTMLALFTVASAVAQSTILSYQAVVRDGNNRFVQNSDIPVDVSITSGGTERYFESRTAHTNHNGVISFSIGGAGREWPVAGHPDDDLSAITGWANAIITVTYHLDGGDVTVNSPVSAVPYALEVAPNAIPAQVQSDWAETTTTSAAYIQNKPDLATVATSGSYSDLTDKPDAPNNAVITIARNNAAVENGTFTVDQSTNQTINIAVPTTVAELSDATDYVKVGADNDFTGTNTVPSGFILSGDDATTSVNCGNVVVNACDLLAVFDSLNRRISALEDALDGLMRATPPTVTVSLSDIYSNSIKATAVANDNGTAITSYEFCISENSDMSSASCFTATTPNYTFTGLDAYTIYYVTAKATNLAGSGTSNVESASTPAHAPAGVLSSSLPPKPTGFQVTVSSLDFKEPAEGTVQIFYKQGSDCTADEEGFTAWPVSGTLYTNDDYMQNLTGLEPNTNYCVMVKVSNEDSTTTYGPVNTTSGDDISLIITPDATSLSLCEGVTVSDLLMAEPTLGDVEEFSYVWSDGTNTYTTNPVTMTFSTAGDKTITCTATHISEGYVLTATVAITVASAGTAPTFSLCENMLVVDVDMSSLSNVATLNWGDGSPIVDVPATIDDWTPKIWHVYDAQGGAHDVVATSESGCTATQSVLIERAELARCEGTAHTGGIYAGQGHGGADDGREYADGDGIYAVTDYDGEIYPVVKIGSQCWLAENLRTQHSPSTDAQILLGADQTYGIPDPYNYISYTSKMAAWASNDANSASTGVTVNGHVFSGSYSEIVPRFGLLYNWCAAVDTFNTTKNEVSSDRQVSTGWSPVLNMVNGNRRGICPLGWHLPSAEEWEAMLVAAGVEKGTGTTANSGSGAGKLVTGCYWKESNYGERPGNYNYDERNSIGFSAIPGGNFNNTQHDYRGMEEWAYFWTSTQENATNAARYGINYGYNGPRQRSDAKFLGASVRCVRDAE